MGKERYKLLRSINRGGAPVEIWHRQSEPGARTWYLSDFEVRISGKVYKSFERQSTTAEIFKTWRYAAGIESCGYPILKHCPTGGKPHYKNSKGKLFYAPFKGLSEPDMFIEVEGVTYDQIKDQPCVV